MSLAFALNIPEIAPPAGATPLLQLVLRWVHFIAGTTWVGLLYFFVLVNGPFLKRLDLPTRGRVVATLMPSALWWFRWASVVTVLAGIWYWMMIVGVDARNAQASGGLAIGSFFGIWTVAFVVEMGLLMSPSAALKEGRLFGAIMAVVLLVAAWLYLRTNAHGWESNLLLAIGIGGGLGWFMLLNVWGIVWRFHKKIILWTGENLARGTPVPAEAAKLAQIAQLAARLNFAVSFPMLLCMAVASHYSIFRS